MVCKIYERIKKMRIYEKIIFMVEKEKMRINNAIPNYCQ